MEEKCGEGEGGAERTLNISAHPHPARGDRWPLSEGEAVGARTDVVVKPDVRVVSRRTEGLEWYSQR